MPEGQQPDTVAEGSVVHKIEVEGLPGRILHTNDYLRGANSEVREMNHALTFKVRYAFSPPEGSLEADIYRGVYQGVGLAYHDLNSQLGHPVSLFLFQGATIKTLSRNLSVNYEWNLGLAYGWKEFDITDNPDNHVIGSKMTAHIDFDIYLRWMLSQRWDLNVGASISHYSNGNTNVPNAGLNILGAKASLAYYFNREQKDLRAKGTGQIPAFERHWDWDLTLYGAWKRKGIDTENGTYGIPGTYGVVGFNLNPLYHINHWLNAGPSLDAAYDGSANITIDLPDPKTGKNPTDDDIHPAPWYRKVAVGLSARMEFCMPYFSINFGIGHNVVNAQTTDFKGFYEILALKINLMRKAYVHIGYSLYDFYYPNNLLLGLGLHL